MRLCEIDDEDKTWAALNGLSFDVEQYFNTAKEILLMLIELKIPHRNSVWLPEVYEIENILDTIVAANLADDESSKDIKQKAQIYINELKQLKGLL